MLLNDIFTRISSVIEIAPSWIMVDRDACFLLICSCSQVKFNAKYSQ